MRKLASIQKIETIRPIKGADKIQVATMEGLGWECVIKKDEFKVGELVIYFEVDSILPEISAFDFLKDKKYRIKIIKLKKQCSQGLIFSPSILPASVHLEIGKDVTEILGVKKHDPQIIEEQDLETSKKSQSKVLKFFMNYKLFRTIYLKFNQKIKGNWPEWISKTDEERIQANPSVLLNNFDKEWYLTEKLDGQSATFFTYYEKTWLGKKLKFGICSRNIWLKTPDQSNYWKTARKYELEKKMLALKKPIVIQGEQIGPTIQKNIYHRNDVEFFVFNIIENDKRVSFSRLQEICNSLQLETVPLLNYSCIPSKMTILQNRSTIPEIVNAVVNDAEGTSKLYTTEREGVVWRLVENPYISFKAISPKFLLQEK